MRCPAGHESSANDYCDTCGLPIDAADQGSPGPAQSSPAQSSPAQSSPASSGSAASSPGSGASTCPHCANPTPANALFCENCGYDFTTGAIPRAAETSSALDLTPSSAAATTPSLDVSEPSADLNPSPAPDEMWVAEIWIDPDWYADQQSTDPLPSPGLPAVVALRHTSILLGRSSRSRNIDPGIELDSDSGVSRRHAQLTTDGSRWFVEDLGSSNGTYVGGGLGTLPKTPIVVGQKTEVAGDDRIYLGAWTRIVLRKAAPGEVPVT